MYSETPVSEFHCSITSHTTPIRALAVWPSSSHTPSPADCRSLFMVQEIVASKVHGLVYLLPMVCLKIKNRRHHARGIHQEPGEINITLFCRKIRPHRLSVQGVLLGLLSSAACANSSARGGLFCARARLWLGCRATEESVLGVHVWIIVR